MFSVNSPRRFGGRLAVATLGALAAGAALVPSIALAQSGDGPGSGARPTPEQVEQRKQCFAQNGVELPARELDANGRPVKPQNKPELTDEQKAAFKAATEACGGPKGGRHGNRPHGRFPKLTDEQKACLTEQGIVLPGKPIGEAGQRPARPTAEQMEKQKAAAEACGIERPARPGGAGGAGPFGQLKGDASS